MNKTIGDRLKEKRLKLGYSIEKVSNELKIRPEFIKALESDNYSVFSSDLYAKGFIKNYSKYLELDPENFSAVYRRDIQSNKLQVKKFNNTNSTENVKKTFSFSRRNFKFVLLFCFILVVGVIVLSILNKTFEPPVLELTSPVTLSAGTTTSSDYYDKTVRLIGLTSTNTVIKVNGVVLPTKTDNTFESELYAVTQESNKFVIEAISNVNVISRIDLTLNKRNSFIEESQGITGAIQIIKDNSLIKVIVDDKEVVNGIYFENDSIPIIGETNVSIQADKPDNIKIVLNGEEFKITEQILKIGLTNGRLIEVN